MTTGSTGAHISTVCPVTVSCLPCRLDFPISWVFLLFLPDEGGLISTVPLKHIFFKYCHQKFNFMEKVPLFVEVPILIYICVQKPSYVLLQVNEY